LITTAINFGAVKQTSQKDTMFVIKNEGDDTLRVRFFTTSPLFTIMNPGRDVYPNMTVSEPIKFSPQTLGSVNEKLYLESNHMNQPTRDSVFLTANVITKIAYGVEIPKVYSINQNYPNPFNPATVIRFGLPNESNVRITIFNSLGQQVDEIVNERLNASYYEVNWNALNKPTGLYFYKIIATDINNPNNKFIQTKKMMLVK
ncbi:MAG: T9SS type A sorting domain-containing protein, partial [Bacteroidetes bacterium]|nr:T9SS type A sorting domain-containing protein [Bacteroidota bacterium]